MILLDTHVWLWWLLEEGNLSKEERVTLDGKAANGEVIISAASVWEAELLHRKGRIKLSPDFETWIKIATKPEVCKVVPITEEIILAQAKLPENFSEDPADRLIVATALNFGYPLATKDERLQNLGN